jgi:polyisoprenoid-binding protein YceI
MPCPGAEHPGPRATRIDPAFLPAGAGRTVVGMSTSTSPSPATTSALLLAPGRWAVDHHHSSVGFTIRHLGISKVRGRFTGFDADVVVGDSLETTSVAATIELASVDTGNADRDAHVQAPDIIDVAQRPTMAFRSTAVVEVDEGEWRVDGEVTIGDVTRPLSLAVEHGGIEDHPMGGPRHAGFEATGELRRSDFGIAPTMPAAVLGDVVRFELDLQLLEPED